jgi:hypothetical protein
LSRAKSRFCTRSHRNTRPAWNNDTGQLISKVNINWFVFMLIPLINDIYNLLYLNRRPPLAISLYMQASHLSTYATSEKNGSRTSTSSINGHTLTAIPRLASIVWFILSSTPVRLKLSRVL